MGNAQSPAGASAPPVTAPASVIPQAPQGAPAEGPSASAVAAAGAKDEARSSRLRRTGALKEKLLQEWQKNCLKECDDDVRRFWVCRQEQGFMAPFRCKEENEKMKNCYQTCSNDTERFDAYKAKRFQELDTSHANRAAMARRE